MGSKGKTSLSSPPDPEIFFDLDDAHRGDEMFSN